MQIRKYFQFLNKSLLYLLLVVSSWFISEWIQNSMNLTNDRISFEIKTLEGGMFQLFYSSNNQHCQKNSSIIHIRESESFQTIQFTLNKSSLTNIRFDPPSSVQIKSISISKRNSSIIYSGQELLKIIKPLHSIDSVELTDGVVNISTNGSDPYLRLNGIREINPVSNKESSIKFIIRLILFISVSLLLFLLFRIIIAYRVQLFDQRLSINIPKNLFIVLMFIVFSWFLFQMLYFAFNIKRGASPDENYHIEVSKFYSEPGVYSLENTNATIKYGSLTTNPHFFYLLMGKLLILKPDSIIDYEYLRLLNIILSLATFYLTYVLSKEITANKLIQISILIAQSNILMFVFLSSMVSYDNLVNLLAVVSFIFLLRFIRYLNLTYLLLLLSTMGVGAMTKVTYLPLIMLELAVLLFYTKSIYRQRIQIFSNILSPKNVVISALFLFIMGANIHLYGGNIVKYHKISPGAELVIGKETALKGYAIYKRNFKLLSTAHTRKVMPFKEYVPKYFARTFETIFSVVGHLSFPRGLPELWLYLVLTTISCCVFIYEFKEFVKDSKWRIVLFLFVSYILVVFYVNYSSYTHLREFGVALQGRYNFPVNSLMVIFLMHTLLFKLSDKAKIFVILIITFFLVNNSFLWFLARVTPNWFNT